MGTSNMIHQGYAPGPGGVILGNVAFIPPGLEDGFKEPFSYNVVFPALAQNVTQTQAAQINNDSYFVCVQQTLDIWDAGTGNTTRTDPTAAPMTARILDTSSGKYQMDQPTPVGALFGTSEQPFVYLYRARLYMPGGQLQLELTSRMAANQFVRATFSGFKVYKVPDNLVAV